jgi:glutamate--cysteine ligase
LPDLPTDPDRPLQHLDDLLTPFRAASKPRERWRVGTEAEKVGVYVPDGGAVPFLGDRGVARVLAALVESHGWTPEPPETVGGPVLALRRGGASITLEPGAQLELSGAPVEHIHQTCAEFRGHMAELRDISAELGIAWLGLGFHPFARRDELSWVPKTRYPIMREYLPTRGGHALDMMLRTCTVQANFDYASPEDGFRKLRLGLRLSPIVQAMLANSPFVEGRATGERSHRARVWLDVDPDRSGLLPFLWRDEATLEDYVQWLLDVPMFLVKRPGGRVLRNTGQTFRAFWRDGFEGERATLGDWDAHLNTVFPEVRLKRTLEVRSADAQGTPYLCALPALWTGIFYDDDALARAEALASRIPPDAALAARPAIADHALAAELAGRPLSAWAADLLEIAEAGLARRAFVNAAGKDERVHLARLRALVERGDSPADELLDRVKEAMAAGGRALVAEVIDAARL